MGAPGGGGMVEKEKKGIRSRGQRRAGVRWEDKWRERMGSVLRRDQSDSERTWGRPLSVSFLHRTSGKECEYHSQAGSTSWELPSLQFTNDEM